MFRDKLSPGARRFAFGRVAAPYIVKAKPGRLAEVLSVVREFAVFHRFMLERPLQLPTKFMPFGALPLRVIRRFNMVSAMLPREAAFYVAELRDVDRIYADRIMWAFQYPTVPPEGIFTISTKVRPEFHFTSTYWTKKVIGADIANQKGFTGRGIKASIVDTGASRTHEQIRRAEFKSELAGQYMDENGHGSWCVACVGGAMARDEISSYRARKTVYCEGMAPECDLLAVKSLGYVVGCGSTSSILRGLEVSLDWGADVISMSLGGPVDFARPEDDAYFEPLETIKRQGIITVVAAGNEGPGPGTIGTPGCHDSVLTVGAYNPITGELADFSSRGPTPWGSIKPDCIAPGVNIDSACVGVLDYAGDHQENRYSAISGTSMATPHVAGLCVLMKQAKRRLVGRDLTLDEVKRMLAELGTPKNNEIGYGPINWSMFETWMETEYGVKL